MKCPKCGETDHATNAKFCHMCGEMFVKKNNNSCLAPIIIGIAVLILVTMYFSHEWTKNNNSNYTVSTSTVANPINSTDQNKIESLIAISLCNAFENNDIKKIGTAYASNVKRYHNQYNVDRATIIQNYKDYDNKFGVYSKSFNVRWSTLNIEKYYDGTFTVKYVVDYHIDRKDKNKFSDFVIEKHLELNNNYQITSEYDVQLSRK